MYLCLKKLSFDEKHTTRVFEQCQSVIVMSTLRKASTTAYTLLNRLLDEMPKSDLHTFFYVSLMSTLDVHLDAIEKKAFNRWTGNREMILLTFKLLKETPVSLHSQNCPLILNVSICIAVRVPGANGEIDQVPRRALRNASSIIGDVAQRSLLEGDYRPLCHSYLKEDLGESY